MEKRQSRASLLTFLTVFVAVFVLSIEMVKPYLLATMMGGILAILAEPLYLKLRARKLGPRLASLLVTLGLFIVVIGPLASFAFLSAKQAISMGKYVAESDWASFDVIAGRLNNWGPTSMLAEDAAALERQVRTGVQKAGGAVTQGLVSILTSTPEILLQMGLALLACFFFVIDGRTFLRWITGKLPLDRDVRISVLRSFQDTAVSTVLATLSAAGVQSVIMFIGYLALGVPAAFLAAGATFVFAWVPLVGSTPIWIVGAIYLYVAKASLAKALIMVGVGILTGVSDNFVRPLVLKGRGDMHPLVSLIAIFGGISMFGIVGVFVGPIIAAVLIALLQAWPELGRRFGLVLDEASPVIGTKEL